MRVFMTWVLVVAGIEVTAIAAIMLGLLLTH
jgi:hypothetical protein